MEVDGDTMQYIIEQVGMDYQMLKQLVLTAPPQEVEEIIASKETFTTMTNNQMIEPEFDSAGFTEEDRIVDGQYHNVNPSKFVSTFNRGTHMTFENGLTISMQWGASNYCEKRTFAYHYGKSTEGEYDTWDSTTAEIAIWDAQGEWFSFGDDTVRGWVSPDEVAEWIAIVHKARTLTELRTLALKNNLIMPA